MERTPPTGHYRSLQRSGPDPVTEADAIVELMQRSTALRRRLLQATIAAAIVGGAAALGLYTALAVRFYGRVAGLFFAVGAIVTFTLLHRVCGAIARRFEARYIVELARRYQLDEEPLAEAAAMLK